MRVGGGERGKAQIPAPIIGSAHTTHFVQDVSQEQALCVHFMALECARFSFMPDAIYSKEQVSMFVVGHH